MKAILVIDVDDISRYHADVYKEDDKGNGEIVKSDCPLKPLPQKKERELWEGRYTNYYLYRCGWNDCLDEILGETE